MIERRFPEDFIWGAATSSYQIEGAPRVNGGGESVWDMMAKQPGRIADGKNGDLACEHIQRFREDVELMSEIGLQAYRFSISWPRVIPEGAGKVSKDGIGFYDRLVDALLEKNISPWVTLFHWDFPYELFCKGGWLNRESADWFSEYTRVVVDTLSDRVQHWVTLNEPQCYISLGHLDGVHAPGLKLGIAEVLLAGHNTLRAHGMAVQQIRARAKSTPVIGASHAIISSIPASDKPEDIEAAEQHMFAVDRESLFSNSWFADPMTLGAYPEDGVEFFGSNMPRIHDGDLDLIRQDLDYFGVNIYSGVFVRNSEKKPYEVFEKDRPVTAMNWQINPESLYWGPKNCYERYDLPIVVTENGMAREDVVKDERIRDRERIEYLYRYLDEYARAIEDGVPAAGYFLWSLLDNFEWAEGYNKRFGIIHVDYETQQRLLKYSAHWYKTLIANHSAGRKDGGDRIIPMGEKVMGVET